MSQEFITLQNDFLNSSNYLLKFFVKFQENNLFSVCLKDLQTKKVCLHNLICAKFWGFGERAMEGMNAHQILTHVPRFLNVEEELATIEKNEYLAVHKDNAISFRQMLLSYDGFVQIRQVLTVPLHGMHNRCVATAGLSLDFTQYIDFLQLLKMYQYYYPVKSEAVEKFLGYFNLNTYFHRSISLEELRTLLAMLSDTRHKQISASLGISPKTVASYLSSIRDKLKPPMDVYTLLNLLRAQKPWQPQAAQNALTSLLIQ